MTLQTQALQAGFAVVDLGTTGKRLHGFRYQVMRMSDKAIFQYGTAKQVRELIAG